MSAGEASGPGAGPRAGTGADASADTGEPAGAPRAGAPVPLARAPRAPIVRFGSAILREAGPEDDARLCALFAATPMEGDLVLAVERDPRFFALYDLEDQERVVYLGEQAGADTSASAGPTPPAVDALGAFLGRDAWLDGRRIRVGYAGDLRVAPGLRGGFFLGRILPAVLRDASARLGCEVVLSAIIASNQAAKRALVERSARFPEKPVYTLLRRFSILSLHLLGRRRARRSAYRVERARDGDLAEVAALLARDHAARPFGYVIDEALLRARLARWPGLAADSFYLARDGEGRLVGVAAPWDAAAVKRFRVLGYRGRMRWVRRGLGVAAKLFGFEPLPPPGGLFRYAYLTHASVAGEDPEIMAALLEPIYASLRAARYHFLSVMALEGDPLWPAYRRFWTTALDAELYAVSPPGSRWNGLTIGAARPGFEMALV